MGAKTFLPHWRRIVKQARRDSNPQPPVLETGALPIELRTFASGQGRNRTADTTIFSRVLYQLSYLAVGPAVSVRADPGLPFRKKPRPASLARGGASESVRTRPYQIGRAHV